MRWAIAYLKLSVKVCDSKKITVKVWWSVVYTILKTVCQ